MNLKEFGWQLRQTPRWLLKHPRERLFVVYPLLLKTKLSLNETKLITLLEACDDKPESGITKFYNLRNCYL
jgi:hypothetical protein